MSLTVWRLFNYFVDLCLLRKAPQDLPASPVLFSLTLLLSLLVGVIGIMDILPANQAILAVVTDAIIMMLLLHLALRLLNHGSRFLQTGTAILGSGILLALLVFPLQTTLHEDLVDTTIGRIGSIAYLLLILWIQLVMGHILRHALQVSLPLGIGLAFTYSVVSSVVIQMLFLNS